VGDKALLSLKSIIYYFLKICLEHRNAKQNNNKKTQESNRAKSRKLYDLIAGKQKCHLCPRSKVSELEKTL
jgi:hypothetical protein